MATYPSAAVDRLGDYNGARYDAQTNPYGFAIGGHRINFPAALSDTAVVVNYVGASATEIAAFAQQTAADRVQTGQDRQAAANSAAAAATFNPALYARLDGATYTNAVGIRASTPRLVALRPSDGATQWDLLSIADREAQLRVFDPDRPGALSALVLTYNGTAVWNGFEMWTAGNSPDATDVEADAGSGGARRMWSPARIWRAARAALPLVTQAIAEAGTDIVARSWSALAVRQAAIAADRDVLVAAYTGANFNGLSNITVDLPAGYSKYRIEYGGLRTQAGSGVMSLRNGLTGGALNASENYYCQVLQRRGTLTDEALLTQSAFVICEINSNGDSDYGEIDIYDANGNLFWLAMSRSVGISGGLEVLSIRSSRYAIGNTNSNRWGRIGLLFPSALANFGYIRIWAVRS